MDRLPPELLELVAGALENPDLKRLRFVNKTWASVAAKSLFSEIHLINSGRHWEHPKLVQWLEISRIADALRSDSIAPCIQQVVLEPAFYIEGFWTAYQTYLAQQLEEPIDVESYYDLEMEEDSDGDEDGSEDRSSSATDPYDRFLRKAEAVRLDHHEMKEELIPAGEKAWAERLAEQTQNQTAGVEALTRLFLACPRLETIEIRSWTCTIYDGDAGTDDSNDLDLSTGVDIICRDIAEALFRSGRSISTLTLKNLDPTRLSASPALRHLFTGLSNLALYFSGSQVDFLLLDTAPQPFVELVNATSPTLQTLDFNCGGEHPQLPTRGVHSILNLLGEGPDHTPIIFPHLEKLCLHSLIVDTPSLLRFLNSQPHLEYLVFSYIYLYNANQGWPHLAQNLPPTIKEWSLSGAAGHEGSLPAGATSTAEAAYNYHDPWNPHSVSLPESFLSRWKREEGALYATRFVARS